MKLSRMKSRELLFVFLSLLTLSVNAQEFIVYFDYDKHELTAETEATLLEFLNGKTPSDLSVSIEAHTDGDGTNNYNSYLARKRAESIASFLVENGIDEAKIATQSYGEDQPVASNTIEDGKRKNRRAVVTFSNEKSSESVNNTSEIEKQTDPLVPTISLKGLLIDEETGKGIPGTVYAFSKTRKDSTLVDSMGNYTIDVPEKGAFRLHYNSKGYFFDKEFYTKIPEELPTYALKPAKVGNKIRLTLYYVGNEAILLPKSKPALKELLSFMKLNEEIKLEIAGHINYPFLAPEKIPQWSMDLSTNRAKVVYDYLVANNIESDRLSFKGYGNSEMVFPRARSEAHQAANRRVEVRVVE